MIINAREIKCKKSYQYDKQLFSNDNIPFKILFKNLFLRHFHLFYIVGGGTYAPHGYIKVWTPLGAQ